MASRTIFSPVLSAIQVEKIPAIFRERHNPWSVFPARCRDRTLVVHVFQLLLSRSNQDDIVSVPRNFWLLSLLQFLINIGTNLT